MRMPLMRFPGLFSVYGSVALSDAAGKTDYPASALKACFRSAAGGMWAFGMTLALAVLRHAWPRVHDELQKQAKAESPRVIHGRTVFAAYVPLPESAILLSLIDRPAHPCRACHRLDCVGHRLRS